MHGHATFDTHDHLVLDADISEGATHHDLVVAAARTIGIELHRADPVVPKIGAGRAVRFNRAGW